MPLLRPAHLMLPLALLGLTGCSGTRFGDQLARSFSQPPAQAPTRPAAAPSAASQTASRAASGTINAAPKTPAAAPAADPPVVARRAVAPAAPLTPAPYRVTIKLPAADPSSPAEAVTDALRAAGVAFEVETIERVPAGATSPAAPVRSLAPAPR